MTGGAVTGATATGAAVTGAVVAGGPWAFGRVDYARASGAADLTAPLAPAEVFTSAERVRGGGPHGLAHAAGRLAAKRAVLRLLALPENADTLPAVEILPEPAPGCRRDARCAGGHPPAATLRGLARLRALALGILAAQVSISHSAGVAVAVALARRAVR